MELAASANRPRSDPGETRGAGRPAAIAYFENRARGDRLSMDDARTDSHRGGSFRCSRPDRIGSRRGKPREGSGGKRRRGAATARGKPYGNGRIEGIQDVHIE